MTEEVTVISNPVYNGKYNGNPLQEAIPTAFSNSQLIKILSNIIPLPDSYELLSDEKRVEEQLKIQSILVPTTKYFNIYNDLRHLIINGYELRNPVLPRTVEWSFEIALNGINNTAIQSTTSDSMFICGISGMGKTTLVGNILGRSFPQVICHPTKPIIIYPQIIWIKFDIPADASRSSICMAFFKAVDKVLYKLDFLEEKPNFQKQYKGKKIEEMQDGMATICVAYHIGIIVIDELQRLNVAKSGGEKIVLQFFDDLSNAVKAPILKIGTPASLKLFSNKFETGRRTAKGFLYELAPLSQESMDWRYISEILWGYQLTKNKVPYTGDINNCLYELSAGIVSCLSRLIELANIDAIRTGSEKVTPQSLKKTFNSQFALLKEALEAIKSGKKQGYDDLMLLAELDSENGKNRIQELKKLLARNNLSGQAAKAFRETVEDIEICHILDDKDKVYLKKLKAELNEAIEQNKSPIVTNNVGNKG
jgi:hypothetical protein